MTMPVPGDGRARRGARRHLTSAVTLAILLAFVVGAAWYGWTSLTGDGDAPTTTSTAAACPTPLPADAPPAAAVQVNVYNATERAGLAARAAGQLQDRGFTVLDVANDPTGAAVEGIGQVRTGEAGRPLAAVLLAWVPGAALVVDARAEAVVDLALGPDFTDVAAAPGVPAGSELPPECTPTPEPAPAG